MASTEPLPVESFKDRGGMIKSISIIFIVLTTLGLALRFRARQLQDVKWMWSDVFMPLSWIFNLGLCIVALLTVNYGLGSDVSTLSEDQREKTRLLMSFVTPCIYLVAVVWPKLAILDVYLFIFRDKYMRITSYCVGAGIIVNCVVHLTIFLAKCNKLAANYSYVPGAHCLKLDGQVSAWSSIANVVTDLILLVLPIPMIVKLMMPKSVKAGIYFTFFIGNLGLAASIARFVETWRSEGSLAKAEENFSWVIVPEEAASIAEPVAYHMAACLMTFRPLVNSFMMNRHVKICVSRLKSLVSRTGQEDSTASIKMVESSDDSHSHNVRPTSKQKPQPSVSVKYLSDTSSMPPLYLHTTRSNVSTTEDLEAGHPEWSRTPDV